MFSETRYALNGDLRVAYRTSAEGERDIVFVPYWFTCCDLFPELPSLQGWVEAMTSLGRLIFFDQPGTGASDPVTPTALPTLEQWAEGITVTKTTGDAILLTQQCADTLASRPTGLIDRGFHVLKGKSASVQVFGLDQETDARVDLTAPGISPDAGAPTRGNSPRDAKKAPRFRGD
jgi:hypothetical protein